MIFAVYCNPTITNVCIKQQASISRRTAMEVFKRPLFTRHRIFIEKKKLDQEIQFLKNLYKENGSIVVRVRKSIPK